MSGELIRMFMLPRGPGRRKPRRKPCPVVRLFGERDRVRAYALYTRASRIDEHDLELAENLYRESIRLDPSNALAFVNLGNVYYRGGDRHIAETLYRDALAIDPRQPEALYNFGFILAERGDHIAAIANYRASLKEDPSFADCWYNLGMSLRAIGKDCSEAFKQYISLEPKGSWSDIARRYI
jgi:Tfp pilus assembly protein PilF